MYVNITKSTRQGKKMVAIFYDEAKKKVKTTHFGDVGYEDYIQHTAKYKVTSVSFYIPYLIRLKINI